jgi:hypothetical protein
LLGAFVKVVVEDFELFGLARAWRRVDGSDSGLLSGCEATLAVCDKSVQWLKDQEN